MRGRRDTSFIDTSAWDSLCNRELVWTVYDQGKRMQFSGILRQKQNQPFLEAQIHQKKIDNLKRIAYFKPHARLSARVSVYRITFVGFHIVGTTMYMQTNWKDRIILMPNRVILSDIDKPAQSKITAIEGVVPGIATWFHKNVMRDFDPFYRPELRSLKKTFTRTMPRIQHEQHLFDVIIKSEVVTDRENGKVMLHIESAVELAFTKPVPTFSAISIFRKVIEGFFNFVFQDPHRCSVFYAGDKRNLHLSIFMPATSGATQRSEDFEYYNALFGPNDITRFTNIMRRWSLNYEYIGQKIQDFLIVLNGDASNKTQFMMIYNMLDAAYERKEI